MVLCDLTIMFRTTQHVSEVIPDCEEASDLGIMSQETRRAARRCLRWRTQRLNEG